MARGCRLLVPKPNAAEVFRFEAVCLPTDASRLYAVGPGMLGASLSANAARRGTMEKEGAVVALD